MASSWQHRVPLTLETVQRKIGDRSPAAMILLAVISILILRSLIDRLRLAYGSSLRDTPGPLHAKFTGLALKAHDVAGNRWYWMQALHKKYGPTVRIAPEEIAICDPMDVKKMHGLGTNFRKRQQPGTAFNIFSLAEPRVHRSRQGFYVNAFTNENLTQNHQPAVNRLAEICIEGIQEDAAKSPINAADMLKWCMLIGYDVAWHVVYNNADTHGLMAQRKGSEEVIMGCHLQLQNSLMLLCFPVFVDRPGGMYADLWEETEKQKSKAAQTSFVQNSKYSAEDGVYTMDGGLELTQYDIVRDSTTFLGAGGEAVGATLVYLIWAVLKDRQLQHDLEVEVATLSEPITDEQAAGLPLLDGVVYEALRLYGGGATHLPRYAPTTTEFGPYSVPPGIAVTSHAGALHRNPDAWGEDAEIFDPKRWSALGQSKALIQNHFQPFSSGARACIATHLVMIEMRVFVANFFRKLPGLKLAPSCTDESMRIVDRFHIAPVSRRVDVIVPDATA